MPANHTNDCTTSINVFTTNELTVLTTTAEALSAYLGKVVVAEVGVNEGGHEWVIFGIPLDIRLTEGKEKFERGAILHVQIGGPGTRVLGNRGNGLDDLSETAYDCQFLWAIEFRDQEEAGPHYVKLDNNGNEVDCSDDLLSLLPFSMVDAR